MVSVRPEDIELDLEGNDALAEVVNVAEAVLDQCRTRLTMSFRFMNRALWRMPRKPANLDATLASDGSTLYFDPFKVVMRFSQSPNEMARDYLHTLLHCVFRQPFDDTHGDALLWTAACDIVIEAIAMEMCDGHYESDGDKGRLNAAVLLVEAFETPTPSKIYYAMMSACGSLDQECAPGLTLRELAYLSSLFTRDDHKLWASPPEPSGEGEGDQSDTQQQQGDDAGQGSGKQEGEDAGEQDEAGMGDPSDDDENDQDGADTDREAREVQMGLADDDESTMSDTDDDPLDDAQADWEEIGKQIEMDLQTLSRKRGEGAGTLMANLAVSNRTYIDYDEFLDRFATMAEDMCINDDEFDYVFYTYGLRLYGNMPLVEPLEYREQNRVREFVIALDTSGSCERVLISRFITHTYEILKNTERFGDEICVHIIQCDARVQSDTVIHSVGELEKFAATFEIAGFGGTDYRPVFDYVDELVESEEFTNLRGLVYFTDGYGTFPETAPSYETVFVFMDDDGKNIHVPPWAMKVIMDSQRVRSLS